jgi:hypothetical protein
MPPEESAMTDVSGPGDSTPAARPHLPPTAGLDGLKYRTPAEAALEPESPAAHRVGWGFISLGHPGDRRRQLRRAVRVAGVCAIIGAFAILPVKRVR